MTDDKDCVCRETSSRNCPVHQNAQDKEYAWYFIEHDQIYVVDSYDNTLMKRDAKYWPIVYMGKL